MRKGIKVLGFAALLTVVTVAASVSSRADEIFTSGMMVFTSTAQSKCATASGGCQAVTFLFGSVLATIPGETILTSSVSLPSFDLGWNGSAATFNPTSGSLAVTINGQTLDGTVGWEDLTASGSGGFSLSLGLSGLTGGGSDPALTNFATAGSGSGVLTYQFVAALGGPTTVAGLVGSSGLLLTSVSGTFASQPISASEGGSTALFLGLDFTVLVGLGGLLGIRRRESAAAA